jgi:hypothetical protein
MTPRELDFLYYLVETASAAGYAMGRREADLKKPVRPETDFVLTRANKMLIRTELDKFIRTRKKP